MESFFRHFGVSRFPWIIQVYLFVFVIFGFVLLAATYISVFHSSSDVSDPKSLLAQLFSISSDGLKLVLGALLGSLSMAADRVWGSGEGRATVGSSAQTVEEQPSNPKKPKAKK